LLSTGRERPCARVPTPHCDPTRHPCPTALHLHPPLFSYAFATLPPSQADRGGLALSWVWHMHNTKLMASSGARRIDYRDMRDGD
jgi:hypothetical protein